MKRSFLVWGMAALARPGETVSGDTYVVQSFDDGALVAVIDALGHGREAAEAANLAARTLVEHAREAPALILQTCHARLHATRGATITVAYFDFHRWTMSWVGVGNVAAVLVHADPQATPRAKSLLVRSGVVGYQLPEMRPQVVPIAANDTLILATDGIRSFDELFSPITNPQWIADRILERYATHSDDALVLVSRCRGGS